jgi:hypothetical protein
MRPTTIAICLLLAANPFALQAQTCEGLPSFAKYKANLNAGVELGEDATAFSAGVSFGRDRGPFGTVAGSLVSWDNDFGSSYGIGVGGGLQKPLAPSNKVWMCPIVAANMSFGPNIDILGDEVKLSSQSLSAGVSVGSEMSGGASFNLIPTASLSLIYGRTKSEAFGESETVSDTYAALNGGVGFLFNQSLVVKPFVNIPLGLEDADATFGIVFSIGISKR